LIYEYYKKGKFNLYYIIALFERKLLSCLKIKEYLKRREVCDFLPKKYVDLMRSIAINHEIDTFFFWESGFDLF